MKKILIAAVSVMMAVLVYAGEDYVFPLFQVKYSTTTAASSVTWTNPIGERILLKSIWLSNCTNGSSLKLVNDSLSTNELPASLTGTTLYYVPCDGSVWVEPAGKIQILANNSSLTNFSVLNVFGARPK